MQRFVNPLVSADPQGPHATNACTHPFFFQDTPFFCLPGKPSYVLTKEKIVFANMRICPSSGQRTKKVKKKKKKEGGLHFTAENSGIAYQLLTTLAVITSYLIRCRMNR